MPRYFTLREAEQRLPVMERLLRRAIQAKQDLEQAETELRQHSMRVMLLGGALVNREAMLSLRNRRDALVGAIRESLEQVQELGAQVKDLETGLIDFPTLYRGREVLLCWRLGEDGISFWHGIEEGFRGRKPIDQDFLEHHEGDRVS